VLHRPFATGRYHLIKSAEAAGIEAGRPRCARRVSRRHRAEVRKIFRGSPAADLRYLAHRAGIPWAPWTNGTMVASFLHVFRERYRAWFHECSRGFSSFKCPACAMVTPEYRPRFSRCCPSPCAARLLDRTRLRPPRARRVATQHQRSRIVTQRRFQPLNRRQVEVIRRQPQGQTSTTSRKTRRRSSAQGMREVSGARRSGSSTSTLGAAGLDRRRPPLETSDEGAHRLRLYGPALHVGVPLGGPSVPGRHDPRRRRPSTSIRAPSLVSGRRGSIRRCRAEPRPRSSDRQSLERPASAPALEVRAALDCLPRREQLGDTGASGRTRAGLARFRFAPRRRGRVERAERGLSVLLGRHG
jgi:hypothetical protein